MYPSVEFVYEARPDKAVGYVAGSKTSLNKRLAKLRTKFGAQIVREYTLAYEQGLTATGKSRLTGIQESAGPDQSGAGGLSFNPTTFTWSSEGDELVRSDYRGEHAFDGSTHDRYMEGDFTGDGRSDFARVSGSGGVPRIDVTAAKVTAPGAATEFAEANWSANQGGYNESDRWLAGDYDLDGRVDVLRFYDGGGVAKMQLYKNQGGSFALTSTSVIGGLAYKDFALVYPADVNGDGRLDLVSIYGDSEHGDSPTTNPVRTLFAVYLNQTVAGGQPSFAGAIWGLVGGGDNHIFQGAAHKWLIGDITGDGLPDLLFLRTMSNDAVKVHAYVNRRGLFERKDDWINTEGISETKAIWQTGDFNGDGLVDLVHLKKEPFDTQLTTSPVTVYLATGSGFLRQSWGTVPVVTRQSGAEVHVGDYNGDGRSDLGVIVTASDIEEPPPCPTCDPNLILALPAITQATPIYNNTYSQRRFLSNGTTGFRDTGESASYQQQSQQRLSTKRWMAADFNGDGMEDLARLYLFGSGGGQRIACDVWTSTTGVHDLLTSATDGMDSTSSVEYKTLADAAVYSKSEPNETVANAIDLMTPMPVVSRVNYDDGLGGAYGIDYQYHGLKADRLRGLLGFRAVKSIDTRTGIWSQTTLRQDFPFTGMAVRSETHQPNGALLSLSTTDYLERSLHSGKVHLPYSQRNVADSYELDGTLTSRTTTLTTELDDFGNTKNISVESLDGFKKTTLSAYDVDTATWQIGKLRNSTVTSSAPGQPDIVRKSGVSRS